MPRKWLPSLLSFFLHGVVFFVLFNDEHLFKGWVWRSVHIHLNFLLCHKLLKNIKLNSEGSSLMTTGWVTAEYKTSCVVSWNFWWKYPQSDSQDDLLLIYQKMYFRIFLKCFHWIQWQKILCFKKIIRTCHPCIRDQDATTAPARHR